MSDVLLPRLLFPNMWMSLNRLSAMGTANSSVNRMELVPYVFQDGMTIDKVGIERNSGTTTGVAAVLIYEADPSTLAPKTLLRVAKINVAANYAVYEAAISPLTVTRGQQVWIGTIFNAALSMAAFAVSGQVNLPQATSAFLANAATKFSQSFASFSTDPAAWVAPATLAVNLTTDFANSGNTPNVMFRAATINPTSGGEEVDITPIMDKLVSLEQQLSGVGTNVTSTSQAVGAKVDLVSTKIDSSTAEVTASVGTVGSKVDGVAVQSTTLGQKIDTANTAITSLDSKVGSEGSMTRAIVASESVSIKGKIDAIDLSSAGVPQNVIDMIMDLHAEALGSWSWDKRTGFLTMLDTHGLEVATFSVTDTPDVASRERRTDLEVS